LYLTGNTWRLHYKAQPVNAVWGNSRCLLWEPYGTHRYTVSAECGGFGCRRQELKFWILFIWTSGFKELCSCRRLNACDVINCFLFVSGKWNPTTFPVYAQPASKSVYISLSIHTCVSPCLCRLHALSWGLLCVGGVLCFRSSWGLVLVSC
jgi:hypothetical protein